MTPPKYIGPHDVPVIRAAVQQMLRDGMTRAQIAERLMAEYVPHDDVARLIARSPLADALQRNGRWRRALFVLTALTLVWYVCALIVIVALCILKPSVSQFARGVFSIFMAAVYVGMLSMLLLKFKQHDGAVYHLGTIFGAAMFFDCLTGAFDGHVLVRLLFSGMALVCAAISILSWVLRRRLFPDLRLFSAPRKDERGRYLFHDSAPPR